MRYPEGRAGGPDSNAVTHALCGRPCHANVFGSMDESRLTILCLVRAIILLIVMRSVRLPHLYTLKNCAIRGNRRS